MNIAVLLDKMRHHNLSDKIYVQVGYNRFEIKNVDITDDGVIIIIEDEANNPPPSYLNNGVA